MHADWESFSGVTRAAARANGATFVSIYDAFNGPGHQQDSQARGYIGSDGEHTSLKGATVIADTFAVAGFEPNTPGRHLLEGGESRAVWRPNTPSRASSPPTELSRR